jgi:tRNA(Ile)-lysidine synthase
MDGESRRVSAFVTIDHLLPRCHFPAAGTRVSCAVSGGPDSLALLVLARAAELEVTAIHVDHGLRPDSSSDADVVADAAKRYGAAFRSERVALTAGPNLEARARAARYGVLPPDVLTGHTADDQAETMLLALMRGAGLRGLRGMRSGPRRPLLAIRRAETHALCAEEGLEPIVDISNTDPSIRRNRVRNELLPLLDVIAERDVAQLLARQATVLQEEDDFLDALAVVIDVTDIALLNAAPPVLARRAVREWLSTWIKDNQGEHHPPDAATVERVLRVARGEARACELPGGIRVELRGQSLAIRPTSPSPHVTA